MGQISVNVNGRRYPIVCEDGEEEHVQYLAEFVDKRIADLVAEAGPAGESQLLLMAALLIADDLSNAYTENERLREDGGAPDAASQERLAERLEAIVETFQKP
jgi:cell division protein ZapA